MIWNVVLRNPDAELHHGDVHHAQVEAETKKEATKLALERMKDAGFTKVETAEKVEDAGGSAE